MLFIPITIAAATLQVARNALQRGLVDGAGPWGATLVRFLFGVPFSVLFLIVAWAVAPGAPVSFTPGFWLAAILAGIAQVGATAALLVAMRRSGFALGAAFQQSSLPFAALVGVFVLGERFSPLGWAGVVLATAGLAVLSWPRAATRTSDWNGALAGLASGACYAVALNGYRHAGLQVAPGHPVLAAVLTMTVAQAAQSFALGGWLFVRDRAALRAVLAAWRSSLGAGFFGAAASGLWLTALALTPAAQVRAVGVVEMPISALVGRRLFAERPSARQLLFGAVICAGVVMATLG